MEVRKSPEFLVTNTSKSPMAVNNQSTDEPVEEPIAVKTGCREYKITSQNNIYKKKLINARQISYS